MRLGLTDPYWAKTIFSLSLQLTPLVLQGLCVAVVWNRDWRFALPPALQYIGGSTRIATNYILEGPVAAAYFWLLPMLILFRANTVVGCIVLGLAAIPAIASHEVMSFLAPLLAAAAWLRARDSGEPAFLRALAA